MAVDTTCSQCGYDLQGLRRSGACPECGQEFDLDTGQGVLGDTASQMRRTDRLLARIRTISLAAVGVVLFGITGLIAMLLQKPGPLWIGGVLAALFFLGAVTSYLYEND